MYFERKYEYVEAGPSFSRELDTFLKYHIPLSEIIYLNFFFVF